MELWNDFEACTVEGRYRLGKVVRSEGRRVWFETEVDGPKPSPALIILTESMNDDDLLLERLRAAEQVQHPNLVAIKDIGTTTVKETPLVYAVTERTEENLEDVLRDRPLSNEEARQLLDGILGALEAIHGRKLIHGRMEPASVLAAGDLIKLRADCIHPVPADASFETLAGEDVRGLGNILFRALTQRSPQNALDPAIQRLSAPYGQIVQHALSGLATTNEIGNLLRPVVTPTAAPTKKTAPKPEATAKPAVIPAALPITARQEDFAWEDEENHGRASLLKGKNAPWILGAFVVLLALIGYFVYSTFRAPANAQGSSPKPSLRPPQRCLRRLPIRARSSRLSRTRQRGSPSLPLPLLPPSPRPLPQQRERSHGE